MREVMNVRGLMLGGCGLICAAGLMLGGCKKTQINELEPVSLTDQLADQKLSEPVEILVVPYVVSKDDVKLDSGPLKRILRRVEVIDASDEEKELAEKLSRNLAQGMVDQFQKMGYKAKLVKGDSEAVAGDLVVEGVFTSVDAGNTAKRTAIGFGAGAAKVRAVTRVMYIKGKTAVMVMNFSSNGETIKKPGAVVGMGSGAAVAGASAAAGGLSEETMNNAEGVAHKSGRDLADRVLLDFPKLGWPVSKVVEGK